MLIIKLMAQAEQVGGFVAPGNKFSKNNAELIALAFYEWVVACDKYLKVVMSPAIVYGSRVSIAVPI